MPSENSCLNQKEIECRRTNSRCLVIRNLSAQFPESGDYWQLGVIRLSFIDDMAFVMALKEG